MEKTKNQTVRHNRQPAKRRLPKRAMSQKKPNAGHGRRVNNYSLKLYKSTFLDISARRFRTNKLRRSKSKPQIVITIPFLAVREIAITKRSPRRRGTSRLQPTIWQRAKPVAALPIVAGVIGMAYFGMNLRQPAKIDTVPRGKVLAASTVSNPKTLAASTPVRLRIDKIGMSAPVIGLGLAANGSLETPPGPDVVGWYTNSPTPGQLGPAVIDGHVDWINNIAVFWRLRELTPGDTFAVDRADGSTATFKVTAIQEFPQDNFPTNQVYGNINYAGIRLITCGGQFNTATRHYDHNIVVFGRLI